MSRLRATSALLSRDITTLLKSSSAGTDGWTLHLSWLQHSAHFHQLFPLDELHGHEHHLQVLKHIQGSHTADLSHGSHFIEIDDHIEGRVKGSWKDPG